MSVSQQEFIATILNPERPVPEGLLDPSGRLAGKRFDVYRNNVASGLTDVLISAFPAILSLVGENFFKAMAGVYLRQYQPNTPIMMLYGAQMAAFLQDFAPAASLPYLPDIARLEQAMRESYHGADSRAIDPTELSALNENALAVARLQLAPTTALIRSDWPIHSIYQNATGKSDAKPVMQPENVLLTRPELDPFHKAIGTADAKFISAMLAGETLADAAKAGGKGFDPGAILGYLLSQNAIISIN